MNLGKEFGISMEKRVPKTRREEVNGLLREHAENEKLISEVVSSIIKGHMHAARAQLNTPSFSEERKKEIAAIAIKYLARKEQYDNVPLIVEDYNITGVELETMLKEVRREPFVPKF